MKSNETIQDITASVIQAVVELMSDKLYKIVLYGSYARGDFTAESDMDIMVILDCSKEEALTYRKKLSRLASRIGLEHDIMVAILLRDKESFEQGKTILPFYQNIVRDGVELYG